MRVELADCTRTLLAEIAMPEATRDSIAVTYALAIRPREAVDWRAVNQAIIEEWSRSALEYIKRKAWVMVEGRDK